MHLIISGVHIISRCRGEILYKYQRHFKELKEKKEVLRNQIVSKRDLLQTMFHSDAEDISTNLLSSKGRKISSTSSAESNWVGYQVEEYMKGGSHESFDVSGEIL